MTVNAAGGSEKEYEDVDTEARHSRASAVINRMRVAQSVIRRPDSSPESRAEAFAQIDSAWQALAGRTPVTEGRLRLMQAIDDAAGLDSPPEGLGAAVLGLLPPELAVRFKPYPAQLEELTLAWRVKTPGRKGRASKWAICAKLWKAATGETTARDVWDRTWKEARRRRAKAFKHAEERARAAQDADRKGESPPPR